MLCDVCQQEAVGACPGCGRGYCADHGTRSCTRCATAIVALDPRPPRNNRAVAASEGDAVEGKGYLQCESIARPTIYLDDPGPPACYVCQGLARHICRNCENLYCPEHAGRTDLCASCEKSARLGLLVMAGLLFALGVFILLMWLLQLG